MNLPNLSDILPQLLADVKEADSTEKLKEVRRSCLGERSPLALRSAEIKQLPAAERPEAGREVSRVRAQLTQALEKRHLELADQELAERYREETVDVSAPPPRSRPGARHPLCLLQERLLDFFVAQGWGVAEGPELEYELLNFDALNIGPDHPARSTADTLFVASQNLDSENSGLLLRTQTSPVQIRALLGNGAPLYRVSAGKVFRSDALDPTHTPVFHQLEGIAVDRDLNLGHLRGTVEALARHLFGPEAKMRLRGNFFPFTEPSAEFDLWHPQLPGGARWVEWGGCGLINPVILKSAGLNPEEFGGFAFGLGVERTLQFMFGLSDMRDLVEGDIRFSIEVSSEVNRALQIGKQL